MAVTAPEFSANGKTPPAPSDLPDEPILTRYSPNHEFTVSAIISVVTHALIGLVALLAGAFVFSWANDRPVVPLGNIQFTPDAGGGGGPGKDGGPLEATPPKELGARPTEIEEPSSQRSGSELNDLPPLDVAELKQAEEKAGKLANAPAGPAGIGGTGEGGGDGPGKGPGVGPGTQAGVAPPIRTPRALRMERWVLGIKYENGADFLRKLANLQAIVAIPEGNAHYRVYSDLHERPIPSSQQTALDLNKLGRIYWSQHDAGALAELARELGLSSPPNRAYMFFPRSLEGEMLRVELAHAKLTEDEINKRGLETKFQAERRDDKWVVKVLEQKARAR